MAAEAWPAAAESVGRGRELVALTPPTNSPADPTSALLAMRESLVDKTIDPFAHLRTARCSGGQPMLLKKELARGEDASLFETQVIGLDGEIQSTSYEITGSRPGRFEELSEALVSFESTPGASMSLAN